LSALWEVWTTLTTVWMDEEGTLGGGNGIGRVQIGDHNGIIVKSGYSVLNVLNVIHRRMRSQHAAVHLPFVHVLLSTLPRATVMWLSSTCSTSLPSSCLARLCSGSCRFCYTNVCIRRDAPLPPAYPFPLVVWCRPALHASPAKSTAKRCSSVIFPECSTPRPSVLMPLAP